jgi:hypothetical protein
MINKNIIFFISLSLGILSAQLSVSLGNVEYSGYSSDIEVPVIINNPNNSISEEYPEYSTLPNDTDN